MKKIIFYLCLFSFVYPVFLFFLPVPTDRILQILGFITFLFTISFRKRLLFSIKPLLSVVSIFLLLSIIVFFAQFSNILEIDNYFFKETINVFFYFFSAYFICYLYFRTFGEVTLLGVLDSLMIVFIIQSIISLIFFISPGVLDLYMSFLNPATNEGLFSKAMYINKRFIGVGSAFFSGVVKYGYGFLILIALSRENQSLFYKRNKMFFFSVILFILCGLMTGRFFIGALLLGVLLYISFGRENLFYLVSKVLPYLVLFGIILIVLLNFYLGSEKFDLIFRYVFEIFVNFYEKGELSSSSSDGTLSMYVFPKELNTWLCGDGKMVLSSGEYYMGSDVGYIRLLFYFGLPATLYFFYVQLRSYSILTRIASNYRFKKLFMILFLWIIILNFKGLATGNEFLVLMLIASSLSYYERDTKENSDCI